jgi:NAD(P)-dependent dehydrogenase (short-subunit alcohol dehydrogenase family)
MAGTTGLEPAASAVTENRAVIITGGSRGLGRNTAVNLARRGVDIIFTYRANRAKAESLILEIERLGRKIAAFQLDVGNVAALDGFVGEVKKTLQHWGRDRFDYLVNNAGSGLYSQFVETTEAQFDEMVRIHCKGVCFLTQKMLPLIKDGGRILNISSVLTRYLAKELGPLGITVNVIAPGAIETDFGGGLVATTPSSTGEWQE